MSDERELRILPYASLRGSGRSFAPMWEVAQQVLADTWKQRLAKAVAEKPNDTEFFTIDPAAGRAAAFRAIQEEQL